MIYNNAHKTVEQFNSMYQAFLFTMLLALLTNSVEAVGPKIWMSPV